MSILHPDNAEDRMAQVPLFCCAVPLALGLIIIATIIYVVLR